MIFFANVLAMNGGSTFLLRACTELHRRGVNAKVLVLVDQCDPQILERLSLVADVVFLKNFQRIPGRLFQGHLGYFGWIDWPRLIESFGSARLHIHVMGVFGLMFARRLFVHLPKAVLSVGIYHQNEFVFRRLSWFLTQDAQNSFAEIDAENVIFFNTSSQENYADFFHKDYSLSRVLPIGINTSATDWSDIVASVPPRIVSIGNLVPFKTYNRHVIAALAVLHEDFPSLQYDIFGDGPDLASLQEFSVATGVSDRVHFHGSIPYSEFADRLFGASLFVGSGTALIEAADLGIPALIGIESSTLAETYGFLNEIEGFSYNEDNIGLAKVPMHICIAAVLKDPVLRAKVGRDCKLKAREFSIERTMDGFLSLDGQSSETIRTLSGIGNARALVSLVGLALTERLMRKPYFSGRRSQSY